MSPRPRGGSHALRSQVLVDQRLKASRVEEGGSRNDQGRRAISAPNAGAIMSDIPNQPTLNQHHRRSSHVLGSSFIKRGLPDMGVAHVRSVALLLVALVPVTAGTTAGQQPPRPAASKTRIVLLGTGTPAPLADRSGPATAIIVNETAYLVDFGPGIVRRASAAFYDKGIKALEVTKLRVAFVTHLHSDHTVGYPDLIFTPWTIGRRVPLEV